ncbi:hypothetical protein ACIO3O_13205 [Streptomyces sp. NPDC087440]|uniref:hypothetical protein n=1 Tax=Streptomyces sp. NPDC087440 TaxID=3365790 RepID=UPI003830E5AD
MLLVDVDGPLNPYAAKAQRRPEGYGTHRMLTPRWEAIQRRGTAAWEIPYKPLKPLRVWLNPDHGPALRALPFDLVWATTWEEEANDYIGPVLGLPELPWIAWRPDGRPRGGPGGGVFWKTPEIVEWARGRAFAWIDDEITDADRAWVGERHGGPALLHRIDPRKGLVEADFRTLAAWANGLE